MARYLDDYGRDHRLSARQRQVCRHVLGCRTEALGGLQLDCDHCGDRPVLHYACRDRHCPRCQRKASAAWAERQHQAVLPVPYHHLVFTLPHALNPWMAVHPRELYALLFETVWSTLSAFGEKRLDGQLGMVAVLHTWGQNLSRHVHLHCLVPGGALGAAGWNPAKGSYLFPVRALSRKLRGAFVSGLRRRIEAGALPRLSAHHQIKAVLDQLMSTEWVVYTKACLSHTDTVVDYLARYTHRIALSDHRLKDLDAQGRVHLDVKDYRNGGRHKTIILEGTELIRRFLLHVLPKGFQRIRHYGYLANRCRAKCLKQIREALQGEDEAATRESTGEFQAGRLLDGYLCPKCRTGHLRVIAQLAPKRRDGG
jgi:hypothetical protein